MGLWGCASMMSNARELFNERGKEIRGICKNKHIVAAGFYATEKSKRARKDGEEVTRKVDECNLRPADTVRGPDQNSITMSTIYVVAVESKSRV